MGTVPKTGSLNVKRGSPVCWAWRFGSPRCFGCWRFPGLSLLFLAWLGLRLSGCCGLSVFWRASPGRSCFRCVLFFPPWTYGSFAPRIFFLLDVNGDVSEFAGTHLPWYVIPVRCSLFLGTRVSVRVLLRPRFPERRTMYCSCGPSWFGLCSEPQSYQEGWIFARGRRISKFALEGRPAEHARIIRRLSWQRLDHGWKAHVARSVPVLRCFFTENNSIAASGCRAESGCSSRRYFHRTDWSSMVFGQGCVQCVVESHAKS